VFGHLFLIVAAAAIPGQVSESLRIEGLVVNGSRGDVPVADAEVFLRSGKGSPGALVARTVADSEGRFHFADLPIEDGLIYLPGANLQGIHYPGPRIRPEAGPATARVTLTVFDIQLDPSPLVCEEFQVDIRAEAGAMAVVERLRVANPARVTYVGKADDGAALETLGLGIPRACERITFHDEFHGRRFRVADGRIVTDIPWPPGRRELVLEYRLPADGRRRAVFERRLDLPTSLVHVAVTGKEARQVACNLPRAPSPDGAAVFESSGGPLPAGHSLEVRLGGLAVPWDLYVRWGSLVGLGLMALVTGMVVWRRRKCAEPRRSEAGSARPRAA
jgi:hypothetical protein